MKKILKKLILKISKKMKKSKKGKKGFQGCLTETAQKKNDFLKRNVTRNRAAIEAKKNQIFEHPSKEKEKEQEKGKKKIMKNDLNPEHQKVALRRSSALLVARDTSHVLSLAKHSTLMLSIVTSFHLFGPWLLRIFVLSGWIFSPTLSGLFLKSHIILLSCSRYVENNSTSSANRRFERQSVADLPRLQPMPFSRQRAWSSSSAACRTVLNSNSAGHLASYPLYLEHIALFVSQDCRFLVCKNPLQEADALWFDTELCERGPQCFVPYRVEGFREVHHLSLSNGACNSSYRELWNFFRLFRIGTLISSVIFHLVLVDFQFFFFTLVVCIQVAIEFPKNIDDSFSWCDDFAFFILLSLGWVSLPSLMWCSRYSWCLWILPICVGPFLVFWIFSSLMHFFDLFAHFFKSFFVIFLDFSSLIDEGHDFVNFLHSCNFCCSATSGCLPCPTSSLLLLLLVHSSCCLWLRLLHYPSACSLAAASSFLVSAAPVASLCPSACSLVAAGSSLACLHDAAVVSIFCAIFQVALFESGSFFKFHFFRLLMLSVALFEVGERSVNSVWVPVEVYKHHPCILVFRTFVVFWRTSPRSSRVIHAFPLPSPAMFAFFVASSDPPGSPVFIFLGLHICCQLLPLPGSDTFTLRLSCLPCRSSECTLLAAPCEGATLLSFVGS